MDNELEADSKIVSIGTGRIFSLQTFFFENGCFILVHEGERRIGGLSIAIAKSNKANVAKVIPSKHESIFISTIAEKISLMINGICLVSLHNKNQLQLEDMKAIMTEIMKIIGSKKNEGK